MPPVCDSTPSLRAIFLVFLRMGALSFGGGMTSWMRRDIVERRGWIAEGRFLSGLALAQIAPGANGVNLAVFVGTTLRGGRGAAVAVGGMLLVPIVVILALGIGYFALRATPEGGAQLGGWLGRVLAGMAAAAIGLNLATGIRLGRRNVRDVGGAAVAAGTAVALGVLRLPLPMVLAGIIPFSFAVVWLGRTK